MKDCLYKAPAQRTENGKERQWSCEGCSVITKQDCHSKQDPLIYSRLIVRCSVGMKGMGMCTKKPICENIQQATLQIYSAQQAQWSWSSEEPTSNKHPTSECSQRPLCVFTNICRFPLMRPNIPLRISHGKDLTVIRWNKIPTKPFHSENGSIEYIKCHSGWGAFSCSLWGLRLGVLSRLL